jgi:hypothetical protein
VGWAAQGPGDPSHRLSRAIRSTAEKALDVLGEIPVDARSGSPRRAEESEFRSRPGGGARLRMRSFELLASHASVMLVTVVSHLEGLAALVASAEDGGPYAQTSASALVRSQLEVSAVLSWMLDPAIDGTERAQRWLRWRLDDVSSFRLSIERSSYVPPSGKEEMAGVAARQKAELQEIAAAFGWEARDSRSDLMDPRPGREGKGYPVPKLHELVDEYSGVEIYSLLSDAAHGSLWTSMSGLESAGADRQGNHRARVQPFGLDLNMVVGLSISSAFTPADALATWSGARGRHVDEMSMMRHRAQRAAKLAGWHPTP